MKSNQSEGALKTWRALVEAQTVVLEAIERELQGEGNPPLTWLEVLIRLARAPQAALRMQDLAEQLLLSRSGVTRLVDRLEATGYVERSSCPSDRRGTYAVLTGAGRDALERAHPVLQRAVQEHFARYLSDMDVEAMESVLGKVLEAHGHVRTDDDCAAADTQSAVAASAEGRRP